MYKIGMLVNYLPLDVDVIGIIRMYLNIKVFRAPTVKKLLTIKARKFIDNHINYCVNSFDEKINTNYYLSCCLIKFSTYINSIEYMYESKFNLPHFSVKVDINSINGKYLDIYAYHGKITYIHIDQYGNRTVNLVTEKDLLKSDGTYSVEGDVTFVYDPSLK